MSILNYHVCLDFPFKFNILVLVVWSQPDSLHRIYYGLYGHMTSQPTTPRVENLQGGSEWPSFFHGLEASLTLMFGAAFQLPVQLLPYAIMEGNLHTLQSHYPVSWLLHRKLYSHTRKQWTSGYTVQYTFS